MPHFLKGNYEIAGEPAKTPSKRKAPKSLTEKFEESALAKLGGSLCFVMKGSTFVWTGEADEETGS